MNTQFNPSFYWLRQWLADVPEAEDGCNGTLNTTSRSAAMTYFFDSVVDTESSGKPFWEVLQAMCYLYGQMHNARQGEINYLNV